MAASENLKVNREDGILGNGPVAATEVIYIGTMCFFSGTGYLQAAAGGAKFAGIAYEYADNAAGADGDVRADFWQHGAFLLNGSGFTAADVGKAAYASDNNTVSLTSAGNSFIGTITRVYSATQVRVTLEPQSVTPA